MLGGLHPIGPPRPDASDQEWDQYHKACRNQYAVEMFAGAVFAVSLIGGSIIGIVMLTLATLRPT